MAIAKNTLKSLISLYKQSFSDSDGFVDYFFKEIAPRGKVITVKDGQDIISACYLIDKKLSIGGRVMPVKFITALSTLPTHRKKGYMTSLLCSALSSMYQHTVPLVMLYPFRADYYAPFGFWGCDKLLSVTAKFEGEKGFAARIAKDGDELAAAYLAAVENLDYYMVRDAVDFSKKLAETQVDGGVAYTVYDDSANAQGYFIKSGGKVDEICLKSPSAINSLPQLDNCEILYPDMDGQRIGAMARAVDIFELVDLVRFDSDYDLALKITDSYIEQNNGYFRLSTQNGKGYLYPLLESDAKGALELDIGRFTALILGGLDNLDGLKNRFGFIVDRY